MRFFPYVQKTGIRDFFPPLWIHEIYVLFLEQRKKTHLQEITVHYKILRRTQNITLKKSKTRLRKKRTKKWKTR